MNSLSSDTCICEERRRNSDVDHDIIDITHAPVAEIFKHKQDVKEMIRHIDVAAEHEDQRQSTASSRFLGRWKWIVGSGGQIAWVTRWGSF
jgi:hypothetical protein